MDRTALDRPWPADLRMSAGIYQARGWLRMAARAPRTDAAYVVAETEAGRLTALLPVYRYQRSAHAGAYDPAATLPPGVWAELAGGADGCLLAGGRAGYLTGWALTSSVGLAADGLTAVIGASQEMAARDGLAWAAQFLPAVEAELLVRTGLIAADELVLQTCEARVTVPGPTFEHYLAALSSARRSTVRRDLARFAESGFVIEQTRLSAVLVEAPALVAQVQATHAGRAVTAADEAEMRRALTAQAETLDADSVVFACRDANGAPVAVSLSYLAGDTLYVRLVGLAYAETLRSASYYQVAYYETIRLAQRLGLTSVHLGIASLRPKTLRGARLSPLFAVFRGPDGRRLAPQTADRISAGRRDALATELGSLAVVPAPAMEGTLQI
jgi:uncharacterized protein